MHIYDIYYMLAKPTAHIIHDFYNKQNKPCPVTLASPLLSPEPDLAFDLFFSKPHLRVCTRLVKWCIGFSCTEYSTALYKAQPQVKCGNKMFPS